MRLASPTTVLRQQVINKQTGLRKKTSAPSASKIAAYAGAFLLLIAVVAIGYQSPRQVNNQASVAATQLQSPSVSSQESPSVDQVVATDVAADLASRANLPIATNVANMSISLAAKNDLAQTDSSAITKPQIIQPNSSRTDIITYTTVQGDSVPTIATKFGISSDTIRNNNNLGNTDVVAAGKALTILPTNGLLYTTTAGDTIDSVASKFSASSARIKLVNNLELTGVTAGQQLIVPDGVKPAPVAVVAPRIAGDSAGGTRLNSNVFASAGNRYAPGNCTWYVYERRQQVGEPIGSYWGNANSWASNARAAGLLVNRSPSAGAVLVDQAGYFGHVAFVERVLPNGDVYITEMNNYAYGGFNQVNDRTISAGQASSYLYIH